MYIGLTLAPFTGLLALMYLWLSVRISVIRGREKVASGQQGSDKLVRAIRAQGNFIEYVPLCLIMFHMMLAGRIELHLINALFVTLLIGRVLHAFSMLYAEPRFGHYYYRMVGMTLTYAVLAISGLTLLSLWYVAAIVMQP